MIKKSKKRNIHESVMVEEVIKGLALDKIALSNNQAYKFIDATVGTGGHSLEIVKRGGNLLGIDQDQEMLEIARRRLKACPTPFRLTVGNFRDIDQIAKENGFTKVKGVLFDLGVTNVHLARDERGFSFTNPDAPLDMRLDPVKQGVKASDILNVLRFDQLIELFSVTMGAGSARWLSKRIIERRGTAPIVTVGDFLEITGGLRAKPHLNPATLPFLAVRIAVNSELENLKEVLPKAFDLLESGGRLVVISFHSGEDAIVKNIFNELERGEIITKKPIIPEEEEIIKNPKARSAKMRILEKL